MDQNFRSRSKASSLKCGSDNKKNWEGMSISESKDIQFED